MRELSVEIEFTKHSLGNVRKYKYINGIKSTHFEMPRVPSGQVMFLPKWWRASLVFATELLCKHQTDVDKICFDALITGQPQPLTRLYKRYYDSSRFTKHEAYYPGDKISLNVIVPSGITDADFFQIMDYIGRYKGISPHSATEYGFFVVEKVFTRFPAVQHDNQTSDIDS